MTTTLEQRMEAVRLAGIGTTHVADYLYPRAYYYPLTEVDDYMALQLLIIDQSRVQCEKAIQALRKNPKAWKGKVKQLAQTLYKPKTYPLPICNQIENAFMRNMTEDEIMAFSIMASYIDDVIQPEIDKLSYSIFNETGRAGVIQQTAMSDMLSCHLFCLIATNILERCEKLQGGSHYYLCANPRDDKSRENAYFISPKDISRITQINIKIMACLANGQEFNVPYTAPMEASITIICNKICDVVNIYTACKEAGYDIGKNSGKDIESTVNRIKQSRENKKNGKQDAAPNKLVANLEQEFEKKGWKIKKQETK